MKILKITRQNLKSIEKHALKVLKAGKIIICPTDTVYGLICDATNKKAVKKIFKIKKRPKDKPFPVFIKDIKSAKSLAYINKKQEKFLKSVWPGKITVRLKRKKTKIKIYGIDKKTICFRVPEFKLLNDLLEKIKEPLVQTSVNISGFQSLRRIRDMVKEFRHKKYQPDLILDGGILKSKQSTIIDLTSKDIKILRS